MSDILFTVFISMNLWNTVVSNCNIKKAVGILNKKRVVIKVYIVDSYKMRKFLGD